MKNNMLLPSILCAALARRFDQIDANRDGQITREELEAAPKARAGARKDKSS